MSDNQIMTVHFSAAGLDQKLGHCRLLTDKTHLANINFITFCSHNVIQIQNRKPI